ncbi:acyl-CoA synthetase (AMP-forming)/AMP-acid ligase II [Planomicrobium koreense]|uniref:Acyl-CoA synthetase (AMP-forming)/AMP-acid ligase II n=1 Tax=Planococcus koreensis TaxID=112331 RepID=A0A7W8CRH7_9BACL|nr:AMP-binding protein [Planococcus koreensis]MBB5178832.1 acyl-CoA synthetase (AMP-forming)/AMP-acid ligase II [Planococcus koreensis]
MAVWRLLQIMYKLDYLNFTGVFNLLRIIKKDGINAMLLLRMAEQRRGAETALIDSSADLSYEELLSGSEKLAQLLATDCGASEHTKTAFLCCNHAVFVQALFAASQTGTTIYLLNPGMSQYQFDAIAAVHHFDLIVFDEAFERLVRQSPHHKQMVQCTGSSKTSLSQLMRHMDCPTVRPKRSSRSKIVLLTGGTTGKPKEAEHKPSLVNFLNPFAALLDELDLRSCRSVYIASPIYYGYGIAFLFSVLALGKTAVIQERFDARQSCILIRDHQIEAVSAVPLMIEKMLSHNAADLLSLKCIASGGAKLNPGLIEKTKAELGDVLYNLYGTSEAGLNIIASPKDLNRDPRIAGKAIRGANLRIMDNGQEAAAGQIGPLCVRNGWLMRGKNNTWIATGDLAWKDEKGFYYLSGREDDMVVSAGVNIYPVEIEGALACHPLIMEAAVIGVDNTTYGQILKAFVKTAPSAHLTEEMVLDWLKPRLAKVQLPRTVTFVSELPYTALGKPDKKKLFNYPLERKDGIIDENRTGKNAGGGNVRSDRPGTDSASPESSPSHC